MVFTFEEALSKIGTEGYTDVEGLIRLLNETSVLPLSASSDASLLLYSNEVGGQPAFHVAGQISGSAP